MDWLQRMWLEENPGRPGAGCTVFSGEVPRRSAVEMGDAQLPNMRSAHHAAAPSASAVSRMRR